MDYSVGVCEGYVGNHDPHTGYGSNFYIFIEEVLFEERVTCTDINNDIVEC